MPPSLARKSPAAAFTTVAHAAPQLTALKLLEDELRHIVDEKATIVEVTVCALLSGGHVLLEDVPGVGKTTYIKALAKLLGLSMSRVQFTSDLLPSDIVGVEVYDTEKHNFVFHQGPIFAQLLLADELNRASPRTQSALLEAMGEGHVTVDRRSHPLPRPFIVFAAQNPIDSVGTYDLPESQLDRFAARLKMGYPTEKRELEILQAAKRDPILDVPANVLTLSDVEYLQNHLETVHISERVAAYVKRFADRSRTDPRLRTGISTRGAVAWLRMARAMAVRAGRDFVTPDDLQLLAVPCLAHRVTLQSQTGAEVVIVDLLAKVEVT